LYRSCPRNAAQAGCRPSCLHTIRLSSSTKGSILLMDAYHWSAMKTFRSDLTKTAGFNSARRASKILTHPAAIGCEHFGMRFGISVWQTMECLSFGYIIEILACQNVPRRVRLTALEISLALKKTKAQERYRYAVLLCWFLDAQQRREARQTELGGMPQYRPVMPPAYLSLTRSTTSDSPSQNSGFRVVIQKLPQMLNRRDD
jgi:hypothetical protein